MKEFKIGQKVRIARNSGKIGWISYMDATIGHIGEVVSFVPGIIKVSFINNKYIDRTSWEQNDWFYSLDDIEHVEEDEKEVEPGPKFKVGDRVVLKSNTGFVASKSNPTQESPFACEGEIVYTTRRTGIGVSWDSGITNGGYAGRELDFTPEKKKDNTRNKGIFFDFKPPQRERDIFSFNRQEREITIDRDFYKSKMPLINHII